MNNDNDLVRAAAARIKARADVAAQAAQDEAARQRSLAEQTEKRHAQWGQILLAARVQAAEITNELRLADAPNTVLRIAPIPGGGGKLVGAVDCVLSEGGYEHDLRLHLQFSESGDLRATWSHSPSGGEIIDQTKPLDAELGGRLRELVARASEHAPRTAPALRIAPGF